MEQFQTLHFYRDLNKCYCGYSVILPLSYLSTTQSSLQDTIATGSWGTGAYAGNPYLKALQQM
jgi:hypothetical protein